MFGEICPQPQMSSRGEATSIDCFGKGKQVDGYFELLTS